MINGRHALEPPPVDLDWRLEPDEFIHLWTETDLDEYPEPLRVRSRFTTEDAASVGRREISNRYPLRRDPDLSVALRTLAKPAVRVIMYGGKRDGSAAVRILGARIQNTAVLAVQDPGPEPGYGGAVRIWLGEWPAFADRLMRALPPTPPGRVPQLVASSADVENEPLFVGGLVRAEKTPGERIRAMVAAQRDSQGVIRVERALLQDRPLPPTYFSWIDIVGDGRYLVSSGYDIRVTAATPETVTRILG